MVRWATPNCAAIRFTPAASRRDCGRRPWSMVTACNCGDNLCRLRQRAMCDRPEPRSVSRPRKKVVDLTTRVLIEIRDEVRRTNARLDEGFSEVNARIDQTNVRLGQTNARLDNLIDVAGDRYRDLDARVRKLEERFGH